MIVAGAGNSIRSELSRRIAAINARTLIVVNLVSSLNSHRRTVTPRLLIDALLRPFAAHESAKSVRSKGERPDIISYAAALTHITMVTAHFITRNAAETMQEASDEDVRRQAVNLTTF
ncbi:hypothetical protein [Bradyrhizobium sp. AC87j1]|uniref:hypothetical protein n=1 Tax=Bradyrhizobium sp. AC87j1 TaxID=2055894 RepID=UPI0011B0A2E2|nr:hypothetical protein [Bradyrhizobium sp. AC87j1]